MSRFNTCGYNLAVYYSHAVREYKYIWDFKTQDKTVPEDTITVPENNY